MPFYWKGENLSNKKKLCVVFKSLKYGREKVKYEHWKGMVDIRKNSNFKQGDQENSHHKVGIWII